MIKKLITRSISLRLYSRSGKVGDSWPVLVICFFLFIVTFLLFISCTNYVENEDGSIDYNPVAFETVSQPYLDKYGYPEDIYEYKSDCYHTINWWWWSKGFSVSFIKSCYDNISGWAVDSEYSFPAF